MTYIDQKIRQRIDEKLKRLNRFRPFSVSAVKKLKEKFERYLRGRERKRK